MKRLLLVLFCASSIASAQDDPLEEYFVPPEQIMRHQSDLGITAEQREKIKQQVRNAQTRFTELQWDLRADLEALSMLLEDRNVSEDAVIEQLDKVLAVEADIKRTQLSMLIALRKVLTEGQLEEARALANHNFTVKRLREFQRQARAMQKSYEKYVRDLAAKTPFPAGSVAGSVSGSPIGSTPAGAPTPPPKN